MISSNFTTQFWISKGLYYLPEQFSFILLFVLKSKYNFKVFNLKMILFKTFGCKYQKSNLKQPKEEKKNLLDHDLQTTPEQWSYGRSREALGLRKNSDREANADGCILFSSVLSLLFIFSCCQLTFSKWQKTWATIAYKFYILHLIIRGRLFCHFLNVKFNNLRQYILLTQHGLISHPWNKSNVTWGKVIGLCENISVP